MLIRLAKSTDAGAIAEIHVTTWQAAYRGQIPDSVLDVLDISTRAAFWREALSVPHNIFVVELSSVTVGFCSLSPSRDDDADKATVAEIAALYVSSRHWRCGIGRQLCSFAFEAALGVGFRSITLWVLSTNSHAISFYESLHFRRDGSAKSEQTPDGVTLRELRMRRQLELDLGYRFVIGDQE